jgi:hypothetical protein
LEGIAKIVYTFTAVQIFRNGGEDQGFDWLKNTTSRLRNIHRLAPARLLLWPEVKSSPA